jgi:hypothetical protein
MRLVPRRLGVDAAMLPLLGFERVASYPTAADARAYFDSWVEFYQDFYQFPADLPVDIGYGFDSYKVTYCTVDVAAPGAPRPVPTIATGNVSVPRKGGRLSTVAYQHGTSVSFYDAPSNPNVFGELDRFFLSSIADTNVVTVPLYVSYLLLAYDDIYDVYGRTADVFRQPYAATVPGLFDMRHFFDDVLAGMPPTSRELLTASFFREVRSNPDHPLRVRLRENAVDRYRLDAPIRVYHSPVDEEVPFEEVLVSVDRLRDRGPDVTVRTLPGFDHVNSWIQAMPRAVRYFGSR